MNKSSAGWYSEFFLKVSTNFNAIFLTNMTSEQNNVFNRFLAKLSLVRGLLNNFLCKVYHLLTNIVLNFVLSFSKNSEYHPSFEFPDWKSFLIWNMHWWYVFPINASYILLFVVKLLFVFWTSTIRLSQSIQGQKYHWVYQSWHAVGPLLRAS